MDSLFFFFLFRHFLKRDDGLEMSLNSFASPRSVTLLVKKSVWKIFFS